MFGLPLLGRDYDGGMDWIEDPYGHAPVRAYSRRPWFRSYFKFAIVRHPLDRLVSAFEFLNSGGLNEGDKAFSERHIAPHRGDFRRFVAEGLGDAMEYPHFRTQSHWLCTRWGGIGVDFVGRYEALGPSIRTIAHRIGLPETDLPHLNRSERASWRDYYDPATLRLARRHYAKDFRRFDYHA